ncbi:MAG: patatin-like phospholipase family protein [Fidelibacterota bacterium]
MATKVITGLALGAGGARGLAHIGVIQVLEEEGIPFNVITGSSMGAVVGDIYCQLRSAGEVEKRFREFINSREFDDSGLGYFRNRRTALEEKGFFKQIATTIKGRIIINLAQSRDGIIRQERLSIAIKYLLEPTQFKDHDIVLGVTATDLYSAELINYTEGEIIPAVIASCSIPGFLPPVKVNGRCLVDGAVACPVPVDLAGELGANFVIGVGVGQRLYEERELDNAIDILARSELISGFYHSREQLKGADVRIFPDTGDTHWSEFKKLEEMVEVGREAARKSITEIKEKMWELMGFWEKLKRRLSKV